MSKVIRDRSRSHPEDRAIAFFTVLIVAQGNGDFAVAAKAQRHLARMGWVVRHVPKRGRISQAKPKGKKQATRREVD
jgi:hypothetical protein